MVIFLPSYPHGGGSRIPITHLLGHPGPVLQHIWGHGQSPFQLQISPSSSSSTFCSVVWISRVFLLRGSFDPSKRYR